MNISATGRNRQSKYHASHTRTARTHSTRGNTPRIIQQKAHNALKTPAETPQNATNHTHSMQTSDPSQCTGVWSVGIQFPAKSPFHQLQKLHLHVVPFL